jgi:hypothetical protein
LQAAIVARATGPRNREGVRSLRESLVVPPVPPAQAQAMGQQRAKRTPTGRDDPQIVVIMIALAVGLSCSIAGLIMPEPAIEAPHPRAQLAVSAFSAEPAPRESAACRCPADHAPAVALRANRTDDGNLAASQPARQPTSVEPPRASPVAWGEGKLRAAMTSAAHRQRSPDDDLRQVLTAMANLARN